MNMTKRVQEVRENIDFDKTAYSLMIGTSLGQMKVEFFPEVAPNHCKNMIALAKCGFYDGLIFHRVIKGFMIQGGCPEGTGMGGPGYTIDQEFNDRPHKLGVLSMARTQDPNSAGSQFFICLEAVSYLDGQYTVFGQVVGDDGLAVVKAIGDVGTGSQDRPHEDVQINKIEVLEVPR